MSFGGNFKFFFQSSPGLWGAQFTVSNRDITKNTANVTSKFLGSYITYLMTALVVGAGWELPLLIAPFIWLSCCCWGPPPPPPPPPGAPAGFTEPLSCPFWLDKPKITGFSVLAVLMFTQLVVSAMKPLLRVFVFFKVRPLHRGPLWT